MRADAGVTESVGDVSIWADQSSGTNDATQATGSLQPALSRKAYSISTRAFFFDGTDDNLDTALSINAGTVPDVTVVTVYMPSGVAAGSPWGEYDGSADRLIENNTGTDGRVGSGAGYETATALFPTSRPAIATIEYDEDAASGSAIYANGTLLQLFTADHDPGTSNTLDIGSLGDGTASFNGHIFEVVVHSQTMTTQERDQIESYLAVKIWDYAGPRLLCLQWYGHSLAGWHL